MQRTFLTILISALFLSTIGCGDKGPKTTPVSISISQKGSPLVGATVTILSADGNTASGTTDSSGVATMETSQGKKGALPGEYGVAVKQWESKTIPSPSEESPDDTRTVRENKLPAKYGEHGTSGFSFTVGTSAVKESFDIPE